MEMLVNRHRKMPVTIAPAPKRVAIIGNPSPFLTSSTAGAGFSAVGFTGAVFVLAGNTHPAKPPAQIVDVPFVETAVEFACKLTVLATMIKLAAMVFVEPKR